MGMFVGADTDTHTGANVDTQHVLCHNAQQATLDQRYEWPKKQRYDTDVTRGGGTEVDDEVLRCSDIEGLAEFHKKSKK